MGFWKNTDTKTYAAKIGGLWMATVVNHNNVVLTAGSGTTKQAAAADARKRLK